MRKGFKSLFMVALMILLRVRYRIISVNYDSLIRLGFHKQGGVLFLPNHPAAIDPIILTALLTPRFAPRPLIVRDFYDLPYAGALLRMVRAVPIPNLESSADVEKVRQVKGVLDMVKKGFMQRNNFLVYPSGRVKKEAFEEVRGTSFVQRAFVMYPDVRIVLVRTTGLWGSAFSRAITGELPDFWKEAIRGCKAVFTNGLFFLPRRTVTIEFEPLPEDFPKQGSRFEMNRYLEKWYNSYVDHAGRRVCEEPLTLVPLHRFSQRVPVITRKKKEEMRSFDLSQVPEKVRQDVYQELARISGRKVEEIDDGTSLVSDLDLDSLDYAGLQTFAQGYAGVKSVARVQVRTVADLLQAILGGFARQEREDSHRNREKERVLPKAGVRGWPEERIRPAAYMPRGETIPEVFFASCHRMGKNMACADAISGMLSYRELGMKVIILARLLRRTMVDESPYVGVLLPSSAAAFIVAMAILTVKKVPLFLNWTAGARSLNFANRLLDFTHVITSQRCLQRIDAATLGEIESKLLIIKDVLKNITFRDKMIGWLLAQGRVESVLGHFHLHNIKPKDPAVVLFTSGTESYPKAVPLSHANILCNQTSSLRVIHFNREDVFLSALPPFHSFGLSITGLLPLLIGLRVFYSPDPTDGKALAGAARTFRATVCCLAPTFYRYLFRAAAEEDLATFRLFITGSEKASKNLFETVANLPGHARLIEGYGITECSPVVTITPLGKPPKGVGSPIPGVKICVIDSATCEVLPKKSQGEICVGGPGVFSGYIGENPSNPFIEIGGERWYRSGDLGMIDTDGTLLYKGRLTRFLKIGSEMVSLAAVEEELTRGFMEKGRIVTGDTIPRLTVCLREKIPKSEIVLFTTFPASSKECNTILRVTGFGRIVKVKEVRQIDEIPLTGTGKIRFRKVQEMVDAKHSYKGVP